MKKAIIILGFILVWACCVWAQGPEIAWEENFDDPNCLNRANFSIAHRYTSEGWDDAKFLVKEFKDGTFRYGLRSDEVRYGPEARRNDQVHLKYGVPKWGPIDLKRYPIVEFKWRGTFMHLPYTVETASGKRVSSYVQWRKTDDWQTVSWRVAPDTSVPGPETAVKLINLDPMILKPPGNDAAEGSDSTIEFDYIRVRGFTAAEASAEAKITGVLNDFPEGRWSGLDEFFPWGIYEGYLRGFFEYWGGDYEGAYGNYTRHHFNYVPANDEVTIGRCGNDPERYFTQMRPLVNSAKATGMRLGADIRGLARDPEMTYEKALSIMKRLSKEYADDDVVVSWKVYDEPSAKELLKIATVIRAIRQSDPLQRPELVVFNSLTKFGTFVPYLGVNFIDHYPINEGARNPWSVRHTIRSYRELSPGKPVWALLPAFETRPPLKQGSFARASDAEFRMMSYLAIAEGAKGVTWFIGWFSAAEFIGMVDRTGLSRGGMLDTLSDLGERLVPVGKQLVATEPIDDPKIKVVQLVEPKEQKHLLAVSVLKHQKENIHFLVAVNEDLDRPRSAKVELDSTILSMGQGVYDLYALDGKNLNEPGSRTFTVLPLAGGDGRFYVICDKSTFEKIREKILCVKALEAIRVLKPDFTIAQRWGLDLSDVDKAIESCKKTAKANSAERALSHARLARTLLFDKIKNDSELNAVRRAFSDMQKELAETSSITEYFSRKPKWWTGGLHVTMVPNPGFFDLSERYWMIGRSYRDCFKEYLKGNKEGLWEKVNKARNECLDMRVDVLAFQREKLKPATESPVQKLKK